jgi:general stress protein 26
MKTNKEKALKLLKKKVALVGSVNENNVPNIKAMLVMKRNGIKEFYFASNNSSMRVKQFLKNNNASLYFHNEIIYTGIMLEGTIEILNDEINKKLIWDNSFKSVYKNGGINDPDYCVLKFTAKSGRYYSMYKTEIFNIE